MRTFTKVWIGIALMAFGFGIAILGIAFVIGNGRDSMMMESVFIESYKDVESVDLQVRYSKVTIEEGDTFSIRATSFMKNGLESYVEDGIWHIKDVLYTKWNIFGLDLSLGNIGSWNNKYRPRIIITVPKGFQAERFDMDIDVGNVQIDTINAKEGDISLGTGRLSVDHINIENNSTFNVDAGAMTLHDALLKNASFNCGVGQITVNGEMAGDNAVSCDIGNIELSLKGNVDDYSTDLSVDVGNIIFNGKSYRTSMERHYISDAPYSLKLTCGVGKITVDFQ